MTVAPPTVLPEVEPLTASLLHALLSVHDEPCVSIYLPTRRASPPDDLNRIVLKGLVADAAGALAAGDVPVDADRLLAPFLGLMESPLLRAPAHDGLAALATDGGLRLVALDGSVEPEVVVDRRFRVLPLVRRLSAVEHCLVVTITERLLRAFRGLVSDSGDDRIEPLPLPRGRDAANGELHRDEIVEPEDSEPHRVLHGGNPFAGGRVHGGFGARTDGTDIDTGHFLRAAARIVAEAPGRDTGWPLVIVAQPRLATLFATLAAGMHGEPLRVDRDPTRLTSAALAGCVGDALRASRRRRLERLLDDFRAARAHGRGSGDLSDIARAAVAGQVATLLLDADRREAGSIDRATGGLLPAASIAAGTGRPPPARPTATGSDLYEDLVEIVVGHGGTIVPLARIQMPTESGVAAIYRYSTP